MVTNKAMKTKPLLVLKSFLVCILILCCASVMEAQLQDSVEIRDPELFPTPATVTDANALMLSKKAGTWYMIKPSQLRSDVDPTWGVVTADTTGNITWLGTVKRTSTGGIAITDFDGDRVFLPGTADVDSSLIELFVLSDTLFAVNNANDTSFVLLPPRDGVNLGSGEGVYESISADSIYFKSISNANSLIAVTSSATTVLLAVEDDLSQYDNTTSNFTTNTILNDSTAAIRGDMVRVLDDLLDVSASGAVSGQIIKFNGTNWALASDESSGSGAGENNIGLNVGGGIEIYKTKTDTILLFRTLESMSALLSIVQTDTTAEFTVNPLLSAYTNDSGFLTAEVDGVIGNEYQTVDSLLLSGTVLTLTLENDGEAPYTVDLASIDTERTDEEIEDVAGAMFSGNTETLITATYQDSDGTIDLVVNSDLSLYNNATSDFTTNTILADTAAAIRADMKGLSTRYNYAALRSDPPTDSLVYISHPTYYGIFRRVTVAEENSGTEIEDSNGDFWSRIKEPGYYNVNWFELGGPVDNSTIDNVLTTWSDVLNTIMNETEGGCTVDFASEDSPKLYEVDSRVPLQPFVTFIGHGDTIRRMDTPWTVVTGAGSSGDGTITVASSSGFRKGQRVSVTTFRSLSGVLVSKSRIVDIPDGTTLDIEGTLGAAISVGDTVWVSYTMFNNSNALNLGDINFDGLVFDGNKAGNPYSVAWTQMNTINIANNSGSHLTVNNCKFHDTPSENIISASGSVRDCEGENLNGSFYHISVVPDTAFSVTIENVWLYNVCLATDDSTGHTEAAIVSSASPGNLKVRNCQFFNGSESVFGDVGGSTDWWELQNVRAENFKSVMFGGVTSSSIEGLKVQNSTFVNCNELRFTGGDLLLNEILIDPVISGNTFINTVVRIEGSRNLKFSDNRMIYEPSEGGFSNFITEGLPYETAMAYFSEFAGLDFTGNLLQSDTVAMTDTLVYGVIFDNTGVFDNLITTQWFLGYGLNCSNNQILNFQRGITCDTAVVSPFGDNRRTRAYNDFHVNNNRVEMLRASEANSWGIMIGPGMEANNNYIRTSGDTTLTTHWPIFALGIDDQGNANLSLPGATVMHNTIVGQWDFAQSIHSIFVGGNASSNQGGFNCIVKYNLTPTPISGGGAIQSPMISRVLYNDLISDEVSGMTTPAMPPIMNYEY